MKKVLSFALTVTVLLLILLCSCQWGQTEVENIQVAQSSEANSNLEEFSNPASSNIAPVQMLETEQPAEASHLESDTFALPVEGIATAKVLWEGRLIVAAQTDQGAKLYQWLDQQEPRELSLLEEAAYIYAFACDAAGLWMLYGDLPRASRDYQGNIVMNDNPTGMLFLAHLNQSMVADTTLTLSNLPSGERFEQLLVRGDYLYLMSSENLYRTDRTGHVLASLSCELTTAGRFSAMQFRQDRLFVLTQGAINGQQNALSSYDGETLQDKREIHLEIEPLCFGSDENDALLIGDASSLYTIDPETEALTPELNWNEVLAEPCICRIQKTDSGFLYDSANETWMTTIKWQAGAQSRKTVLSLAVTTKDIVAENLQGLVRSYNASQDGVQIQYTIYSDNPGNEYFHNDLLRTKILAGESPDLFAFCSTGGNQAFPIEPKLVCADLATLLSTDDIIPGLLAAVQTGEHLYLLPLSFALDSFLVSAEHFPSSRISLQELDEVRHQLPDIWNTVESWNTPENLFSLVSPFLLGACVDWAGYTCSFDSSKTWDILNWCKTWGREETMDDRDERVILRYKQIASLSSLVGLWRQAQNWFDGADYRYVGIPGIDSSASAYGITVALGISQQCEQTEFAIDFLLYALDYMGENSVSLPADSGHLAQRMAYYLDGNATDPFGNPVRIEQEDADRFFEMLSSVSILKNENPDLLQILSDEAARFFSGQCDERSAAQRIQQRAKLVLSELSLSRPMD